MSERTLAIIKPDAEKDAIGDIINRYEKAGLAGRYASDAPVPKPRRKGFMPFWHAHFLIACVRSCPRGPVYWFSKVTTR